MRAAGIDLTAAIASDRYLALDAVELLACITVDGVLDPERFADTVGGLIERAAGAGRRVRIYGEMVALLWEARDVASVITLEDLWNDLAAAHEFTLLCAYPMHAFEDRASTDAFRRICEQHTTVVPGEEYGMLDGVDEQRRAVALLQQERAALRAEVTRLRAEQEVLVELAYVDALTGVANRRAFDTHLRREWALSMRDEVDTFVLVADLDGFKAFNDTHGHAAGDEALRQFVGALRLAARSTDILARIGGDEFGILLVRCPENAVQRFEDRVREAMADDTRPHLEGLGVSLGHASLHGSTTASRALRRADLAMYARKRPAAARARHRARAPQRSPRYPGGGQRPSRSHPSCSAVNAGQVRGQ